MLKYMLMVTVMLVVGCGGGDDGGGGGGVDASLVIDAPAAGGCTTAPDNCGGETICLNSSCVAAFPRVYAIRNISVTCPTTDPDGAAWDTAGGAPDLFARISVNGTASGMTAVVNDQFSATFAGPLDVSLIAGSTLLMEVFDEDVTVNDVARGCVANPFSAQAARTRVLTCPATAALCGITYAISPK